MNPDDIRDLLEIATMAWEIRYSLLGFVTFGAISAATMVAL